VNNSCFTSDTRRVTLVTNHASDQIPTYGQMMQKHIVHTKLYIDLYFDPLLILKLKVPHRTSASYYLKKIITPNVFLRVWVMVSNATFNNISAI
jgi:hypothetical protein